MRIKKEELKKIREQVAEQLEKVPNGQKIKLPKEILEALIFDYYVAEMKFDAGFESLKGQRVPFKLIGWNMLYYHKLDLSEVSFDNVYWGNEQILLCTNSISPKITEDKLKYKPIIDLSHTNAKIKFSEAIPIVKMSENLNNCHTVICVSNINFSNTDLSNNNICEGFEFISTNLSHTNINISISKNNYLRLYYCDLSGVSLFDQHISKEVFKENGFDQKPYISYCVLRNTGLNISLPSYSYINTNDILKIMITAGNLKGCYINGTRIGTGTKDERFKKKEEMMREYEKYRDMFEKTISDTFASQLVKK